MEGFYKTYLSIENPFSHQAQFCTHCPSSKEKNLSLEEVFKTVYWLKTRLKISLAIKKFSAKIKKRND